MFKRLALHGFLSTQLFVLNGLAADAVASNLNYQEVFMLHGLNAKSFGDSNC